MILFKLKFKEVLTCLALQIEQLFLKLLMPALETFISLKRRLGIQWSRLEIHKIVVVLHSLPVLNNFILIRGLINEHCLHWCTATILLVLGVLIQLHRLLHSVIGNLIVGFSRLVGLIVSCVVE